MLIVPVSEQNSAITGLLFCDLIFHVKSRTHIQLPWRVLILTGAISIDFRPAYGKPRPGSFHHHTSQSKGLFVSGSQWVTNTSTRFALCYGATTSGSNNSLQMPIGLFTQCRPQLINRYSQLKAFSKDSLFSR